MNKILLSKRSFSIEDQKIFSEFSGDINPIHLSEEYSRKTQPGEPIVHGINTFLWALDSYFKFNKLTYKNIAIKFLQPIHLNEEVFCYFYPNEKKIEVSKDDIKYLSLIFNNYESIQKITKYKKTSKKLTINNYDINDLISIKESETVIDYPHSASPINASKLFPNLDNILGINYICEIAALSSIVGMILPGLHSIFVSLKIELGRKNVQNSNTIKIIKADKRFQIVDIKAAAENTNSLIRAIVRAKPVEIISSDALSKLLNSERNINKNILVIGGSRGLGSITVKILSLLGCAVTFTYAKGKEDAMRLKDEISHFNKNIHCIKYDINTTDIKELYKFSPEYIFYFPTPKIFVKRKKSFEDSLYKNFQFYYVEAFQQIFKKSVNSGVKGIFYPSSIAIEDSAVEMPEYVKAKIEGENLCKKLSDKGNTNILVKRLPRTHTDQTATNLNIKSENAFDIMMPIIKEFIK